MKQTNTAIAQIFTVFFIFWGGKLYGCLPHFINTYHTSTFNSSHVVRPQTNRTESSHGRATCSKADAQHGTKHGLLLFLGSTARRDEPPHESPHVASWQQMATLSLWHLLFLRPSFQYIFFLSEPHDLFFYGCSCSSLLRLSAFISPETRNWI